MSEDTYKKLNRFLDGDKSEEGFLGFCKGLEIEEMMALLVTGDGIGKERKGMVIESLIDVVVGND